MKKSIVIGVIGFFAGFCLGSYKMYYGLLEEKRKEEEIKNLHDYDVEVDNL